MKSLPRQFIFSHPKRGRAFTLIELLVVLAILIFVSAMIVPAFNSIANARAITKTVGDVAGLLQQARAYAMANNTYVYVGFYEADASQAGVALPVSPGVGRLYIGVVASKDGSCGYDEGSWSTNSSNLASITRVRTFDGVHLTGKSIAGTLRDMDASSERNLDLSEDSATPFVLPLGNSTCSFSKVMQFGPSGIANIIADIGKTPPPASYIQFGFVPAHGSRADVNAPNCAGIQIDGLTSSIRTFRPGQL